MNWRGIELTRSDEMFGDSLVARYHGCIPVIDVAKFWRQLEARGLELDADQMDALQQTLVGSVTLIQGKRMVSEMELRVAQVDLARIAVRDMFMGMGAKIGEQMIEELEDDDADVA